MIGVIILVILVVVILAAVIAVTAGRRGREGQADGKQDGIRDLKVDAVEMKRKKVQEEDPEVAEARKELYQYLTQTVKKMFVHYRRGNWDKLTRLPVPSEKIMKHYDAIRASVTPQSAAIMDDLFGCMERTGTEETEAGTVTDPEKLRETFLHMTLPFYPVYYDRLDGVRYTALLNQTVLNLFHRLTGKKFRLGYRNRYRSGVTAYRWEGRRYQVFAEDGTMLCDAEFRNGRVWNGFARVLVQEHREKDWELIRAGQFREGELTDGTLQYIYRKKCGQI